MSDAGKIIRDELENWVESRASRTPSAFTASDADRATDAILGALSTAIDEHNQDSNELCLSRTSLRSRLSCLEAENTQLRDSNANLIHNAEILADELIHATAERDEFAAALNEALPKLWTYERDKARAEADLAAAEARAADSR